MKTIRFQNKIMKQMDSYIDKNKDSIKNILVIFQIISYLGVSEQVGTKKIDTKDVLNKMNIFYTTYYEYIVKLNKTKDNIVNQIDTLSNTIDTFQTTLTGSNDTNFQNNVAKFCEGLFYNKLLSIVPFPDDITKNYQQINKSKLLNQIFLSDSDSTDISTNKSLLPPNYFIFNDVLDKLDEYLSNITNKKSI